MYDEYKGAKYADVPDYIGDQGKLDGVDEEQVELDLTPNTEMRKHLESIVRDGDFQELLENLLDTLESDDIDYVKGMMCAMHNDYFRTLAENYCYKNKLPIEMAEDIEWEFNKQEIQDEENGCSDYETKEHWVRDELEDEEHLND